MINKIKNLWKYASQIGFFHLVSANLLLQLAGFGMQILLAGILDQDDIADITVLQSFYSTLILVAQLGINIAIIKLCSENIEEQAKKNIIITGIKISVISSVIVVLGVIIASYFQLFSPTNETINQIMRIYILHMPFVVMNYIGIAYLQSQSKVKLLSKYQIVTRLFIIGSILGASFAFGLYGYIYGLVISNAIAFLVIGKVSLPPIQEIVHTRLDKKSLSRIIHYSKFALIANIIFQLINNIGILMANYYITDDRKDIATYGMAVLLINGLIMVPASYNQIMLPNISRASHDLDKVRILFKDYIKKMLILVTVLFVAAYVVVPLIIPFLLGHKYDDTIGYFKVLAFGLFLWGIYSPIGNTLISIGKMQRNVISNLLILIILVVLNMLWIPRFGVMGLAYAFILSNFAGIFINAYMLHDVLKIKKAQ